MLLIRKMGPIGNLLGMLPGAAGMKDALANVDEKQLDRVQAIIRGMTPAERDNPKIINGSRRLRIANGSGVTVTDVNQLVDRFFDARKMMSQMAGRMGMPGAQPQGESQEGRQEGQEGRSRTRRRRRCAADSRAACPVACPPASRTCRTCLRASTSFRPDSRASTSVSSSVPRRSSRNPTHGAVAVALSGSRGRDR